MHHALRSPLVVYHDDRCDAPFLHEPKGVHGQERPAGGLAPGKGGRLWLRVRNDRYIVTIHTSTDGRTWEKYPVQMEVSGYHHNVAGQFLALKPAIYAAGEGKVRFRDFRYRALDY